jgi:hypothetical protein
MDRESNTDGNGDDIRSDASETDGIIEAENDVSEVEMGGFLEKFSTEEVATIGAQIAAAGAALDSYLESKIERDAEMRKYLFEPVLSFEIDGEDKQICGNLIVLYVIFINKLNEVDATTVDGTINLSPQFVEMDAAIEILLSMDEETLIRIAGKAKEWFFNKK